MGKYSQYKQSFREEWKTEPMFQNWIESVKGDNLKAFCKHCNILVPAYYVGLTNHASSAKHCQSVTKNENKLLRQSPSLLETPKKSDKLSKQHDIRKLAKHIESSGEASQEHDHGLCTLELTVDDMTCQTDVSIAQKLRLEACKKIARETAVRHKDSAAQGFEIADMEHTTTSEDIGSALNEKLVTSACDDLLQRSKKDMAQLTSSVNSNGRLSQQTESEATPNRDKLSSGEDTLPALNSVQKYLSSWNSDPMLRDWVAPVPGNVCQAQCRWCRVELRAQYKDLRHHLESAKHTDKGLLYKAVVKTEVSAQVSSILGEESAQQTDINSLQHHHVVSRHRGNSVNQLKGDISNQSDSTDCSPKKPKTLKSKVFVQKTNEQGSVSSKQDLAENVEDAVAGCSNNKAYQVGTCDIPVPAPLSVDDWLSKSETSAVGSDDSPSRKYRGSEDDPMQVKRYPQKYVMRWNNDPVLRDWVAPVAGNLYKARCRWCQVELRAHYKDLKHHAQSTKHATSGMMMHDGDFETEDSAEESVLTDEESFKQGTWKRLKTSVCSSERMSKQNPCYFLSRSSWDRYKQKYRKAWELDPNFRGWIAPVEGDIFRARCLYCRVLIRAHHKDLKEHSKTTKHATNVGYGLPYSSQLNDASTVLPKPKMLKQRVITRRKRKRGFTRGPYSVDIGQEDSLLKPDDSLASMESLVSLASMSCLSKPESSITTLVFPNATQLDESVAAALPNNPKTLYRVKKLSSAVSHIPAKKSKMSEESYVQDQMTRLVRKVTLWEFLKMKVERSNGGLRIPEMLSEFESLYDQIRQVTKERLQPVNIEDTSKQQGLRPDTIMVLSSDRLAKLLDLSVGHYRIKENSSLPADDGKDFILTKRTNKASATVSADGSSLITVHSMENCNPAGGLQSSMFSTDHVVQREDVMTASELVLPTADHIIQLQDSDCLTPSTDNSTQIFTNPDGTFLIHVSGPQRQIPLDVIQYLLAAKEEDTRRLNSATADATVVLS